MAPGQHESENNTCRQILIQSQTMDTFSWCTVITSVRLVPYLRVDIKRLLRSDKDETTKDKKSTKKKISFPSCPLCPSWFHLTPTQIHGDAATLINAFSQRTLRFKKIKGQILNIYRKSHFVFHSGERYSRPGTSLTFYFI